MKKKHIVIAIYFLYMAVLFVVCAHYDLMAEKAVSKGFNGLGENLQAIFSFMSVSYLTSTVFLVIAYSVYSRFSFLFSLLSPFFTAFSFVIVGLALNFILWITQLGEGINDFQKFFIIATMSSMITMFWLLKDMFTDKSVKKDMMFEKY